MLLAISIDKVEAAINKFDANSRAAFYKSVVLTGIMTLDEGNYRKH